MSGLDTRYIPINTFQEIFLDKDDGCELAGGVVKFFKDNDRTPTGAKEVFQLTGSPPNYTYTSLGTELTLSGIGTFQDGSGNDITVYLFPYDDSGNIELYYATVESSGAVPQFTREGFPNISQEAEEDELLKNFVPNGQFLLHHDIPADPNGGIEEGEITSDVVDIAEGGWTFERTAASTAKDFVLFDRIGSYVETPSKSPRYTLRVKNESPGVADVFKDARIKFRDVNKFASDTNTFTFGFQAKSNTGSTSVIEVKLIKNYGTGGSAEETTLLQSITLTTDYLYYDIPFIFGDNDGKTIGNDDDDFVQLVISFPVANVFDDSFDNFILIEGDKQIDRFPDTTDAEFIRDSLAGWPPVPNYEGENLYLPVVLGPKGFEYDTSGIGRYEWQSYDSISPGFLDCDGSKFRVAAYSSDGIPYSRLYDKWSSSSTDGLSRYGTGDDEMRFMKVAVEEQTFTDEVSDLTGTDDWQSFTAGADGILEAVTIKIGGTAPTSNTITIYDGAGTSGNVRSVNSGVPFSVGENTIYLNTPSIISNTSQYTIRIESNTTLTWKGNVAGGYAGGSYNGGASDAWFKTLIRQTSATATYSLKSNTAGSVTSAADGSVATGFTFNDIVSDPYVCNITAVAASGMTAGAYWIYNTTDARKYIVWYAKDGAGTQPVESANIYIQVDLLSGDADTVVANKTALAINSYSIRIPDWRGYFMRNLDDGAGIDPDSDLRVSWDGEYVGDIIGTTQQDEFKSHTHGTPRGTGPAGPDWSDGSQTAVQQTNASGGNETRPTNFYAKLVVRY